MTNPERQIQRLMVYPLVVYALWLAFFYRYHFIDGVNLLIHEAGHIIFGFMGEWIHFLGGTLAQLLMPAAFMWHFQREGKPFAVWVCGFWLGESTLYMAEYMGDAKAQQLPLVGGGIHDWNWMLSRLGLLDSCTTIAGFFHLLGVCWIFFCLWKIWSSTSSPADEVTGEELLSRENRR